MIKISEIKRNTITNTIKEENYITSNIPINLIILNQQEYDNSTPEQNTLYIIREEEE